MMMMMMLVLWMGSAMDGTALTFARFSSVSATAALWLNWWKYGLERVNYMVGLTLADVG